MMKKTLLTAMACVLALGLSASTASALAIGDADPNYIGWVDPGTPADAGSEVYYIDFLLGMALSTMDTDNPPPNPPDKVYTFSRSDNACVGCPDPTTANNDQGNQPSGSVDVTGWTYLVAKYGSASHVWYVGDLDGFQDVPLSGFGGFDKNGKAQTNGQSHYSLYNPETVPDGGATAGLLGLAMLGLGYLRRRIS